MSLLYTKPIVSLNITTPTTNIATIAATTTTTTTAAATTTATSNTVSVVTHIHNQARDEAMDIVVTKIISLLILTILSVLCGLLPLRLLIHTPYLFTRSKNSVDCFLCGLRLFSGGIYMATCFLHLMPDTREKMAVVMLNMGSKTSYAVPELLVMSGFYGVVFVEQIIQILYAKAQESEARRKLKKANKARVKGDPDSKSGVRIFRSTLDEDVGGQNGKRPDGKGFSDDEDDDDDNVLIDDEDDLSFNDADSDRKSLDSTTAVKESFLHANGNHRLANHRNGPYMLSIPNHVHSSPSNHIHSSASNHIQSNASNHIHSNGSNHILSNASNHIHSSASNHVQSNASNHVQSSLRPQLLQQQLMNHAQSCSYSEMGTQVLRTFSRAPSDVPTTTASSDGRPGQISGPPMIHAYSQQHNPMHPLRDFQLNQNNQPNHYHHQPPQLQPLLSHQQDKREQQALPPSSPSPPPLLPRVPLNNGQQQLQQSLKTTQRPSLSQETPFARMGVQYPVITQSPEGESADEGECDLQKGSERGTNTAGESTSKQSGDAVGLDKDADSGVFSTRRECDIESETRKFTASREASFDRISESDSAMQDIQVKRVVDELSRNDQHGQPHFRSIVYIMALSFHGIFEGMALGLQSMKSSIWALCFAIVVHRCVLAFKLGMDLCRCDEKQGTTFLCIGTFTLISTLGIIIGILISSGASLYSDVTVPEVILQSLATGTIFYIVFFDILFKDMDGKEDLKRVSSSFVGFSLMAIVFAITRS